MTAFSARFIFDRFLPVATLSFLVSASTLIAADLPEPGGEKGHDPALVDVPDQPGLPRVLLIGDSISLGYTADVRELLKGTANVHRVGENGGPTSNGLKEMTSWLATGGTPGQPPKWDVIHFNFGLHDLKQLKQEPSGPIYEVPPDDYAKNLQALITQMKATGAKLIWASTTPVPDGPLRPMRSESDVVKYNQIAAGIMQQNSIPIDDLFNAILPQEAQLQVKNNVHFSKPGYQILAQHVADSIKTALGTP
jgi:lysophospholipase L1-like esterase